MEFRAYPNPNRPSEIIIELSNGSQKQDRSFEVLYSDEDRKVYGRGATIESKGRAVLMAVVDSIKTLDDVKAIMQRGKIIVECE
jgi:hypothetical protein